MKNVILVLLGALVLSGATPNCEGEMGLTGATGEQGEKGANGFTGVDGETGPTGESGPCTRTVYTAVVGPDGITLINLDLDVNDLPSVQVRWFDAAGIASPVGWREIPSTTITPDGDLYVCGGVADTPLRIVVLY